MPVWEGQIVTTEQLLQRFQKHFALSKSGELPYHVVREMILDDAVQFVEGLLEYPIRQQDWHLKSKNMYQAAFAEEQLRNLWDAVVDSGVVGAYRYGYEGGELLWDYE